ncbi:MAG: VCBS repeat-containing protein [Bacteroidales bacterium]|nr:VCBS repeat-containing protein [Bacteroidales bacterium]
MNYLVAQDTIQLPCTKDTYMSSEYPDSNFGFLKHMIIGNNNGDISQFNYSILECYLSGIPSEAEILSANLTFHCDSVYDSPIKIKPLEIPWCESFYTFNFKLHETNIDSLEFPALSKGLNKIDITPFVQNWVGRNYLNAGIMIEAKEIVLDKFYTIRTSDYSSLTEDIPQLEIIYNLPAAYSQLNFYPEKDIIITNHTGEPTASRNNEYNYSVAAWSWSHNGTPSRVRSLIQFDLDHIPDEDSILSATLYLINDGIQLQSPLNGPNDSWLLRILEPWDADTITWNNGNMISTINTIEPGAIYLPGTSAADEGRIVDVTDLVRAWKRNEINNYGLLFKLNTEVDLDYRKMQFASSDNEILATHPRLEIKFYRDQLFTQRDDIAVTHDLAASYGASWADFNNDGWEDLFIINNNSKNCLYKNNGDGSFTKITIGSIVNDVGNWYSSSWGDIDNDGFLDLFVTNVDAASNNKIYHNNGNETFTEITTGVMLSDKSYSTACAWGDYDNDGFVDLYVSNRSSGANWLYKNNGDLTFSKITGTVVNDNSDCYGIEWCDINEDGNIDLYVTSANPASTNFLYFNQGDGTFIKDNISNIGSLITRSVYPHWIDVNNDLHWDLFVSNGGSGYSSQNNFYYNNGEGTFHEDTLGPFVASISSTTCSPPWGDFNNDGYIDVIHNNYLTAQPNNLYLNTPSFVFDEITSEPFVSAPKNAGMAYADYDNDGDLDLFMPTFLSTDSNLFFENTGTILNYLKVKCVGVISNAAAIGAIVKIKADGHWQMRKISGSSGVQFQSTLISHFGIGNANTVDSIIVEWPSGLKTELSNISSNQKITVYELSKIEGNITFNGHLTDTNDILLYPVADVKPSTPIREGTSKDGTYSIDSIPAGLYKIMVIPKGSYSDSCISTYYKKSEFWENADTIFVSGILDSTGTNIDLLPFIFTEKDPVLVLHYPFNNDTIDISGNNHHAINHGALTGHDRFGFYKRSFNFNGMDGYISCNDSLSEILNNISVSFWVQTTNKSNSVLISKYDPANNSGFYIQMLVNGNVILSGKNGKSELISTPTLSVNISDGNPHHIVGIINDDKWEIIVDTIYKSFVDAPAGKYPFIANTSSFKIGETYAGAIDDIYLYNYKISLADIQNHFMENRYMIEGIITYNGNLINNGIVYLYDIDSAGSDQLIPLKQCNLYLGTYSFDFIYPHAYKVLASPGLPVLTYCSPTFYQHQRLWEKATDLVISVNNRAGIDIELLSITPGHTVKGNVYTCNGPLITGNIILSNISDVNDILPTDIINGQYELTEVPTGTYNILAKTKENDSIKYKDTYYVNSSTISVRSNLYINKDTSEINIQLLPTTYNDDCYLFRGDVYAGDQLLSEGTVELYNSDQDINELQFTTTINNGSYNIPLVYPGKYKIKAIPDPESLENNDYYPTWYTHSMDILNAYEFNMLHSIRADIQLLPKTKKLAYVHIEPSMFTVYPNPFNEKIHIYYSVDFENSLLVKIIGIDGNLYYLKVFNNQNGEGTIEISTDALPRSIYILDILINDEGMWKSKIIKQ